MNSIELTQPAGHMELVPAIALLLHPLLASGLVVWVWWQYTWRKHSKELKGDEREQHRARHERNGERLLVATGLVIVVAFVGRMVNGWYTQGSVWADIWPQSLHGYMGPVGFALLVALSRFGRETKTLRENGESYALAKTKHGRAADLVIYLVFLHAFMGFIYTFDSFLA